MNLNGSMIQECRQRDSSADIYRCWLMLGICFLHVIIFGGHVRSWLANLFEPCVCGFVFISGYYGIRFKWQKLIKLYGVSLFCALFTVSLVGFGVDRGFAGIGDWFYCVLRRSFSHWFLNAYFVLMLIVPLLNKSIDALERQELKVILLPFLFLAFVWNWAGGYAERLHIPIPQPAGFGSYTFLMMVVVYVIARIVQKFRGGVAIVI